MNHCRLSTFYSFLFTQGLVKKMLFIFLIVLWGLKLIKIFSYFISVKVANLKALNEFSTGRQQFELKFAQVSNKFFKTTFIDWYTKTNKYF